MILKWHIEQNALESSQYSLTHFMVVGLIEGLGDDVDVPGVLNLFVSDSTELVGWPSIISLPTLIILPPPPAFDICHVSYIFKWHDIGKCPHFGVGENFGSSESWVNASVVTFMSLCGP